MSQLEFWYDFASTYSYLSAMRIERLAARHGVQIAWRPFLLGPIFREQGWNNSPFNLYPAKGRYMIRDLERTCENRGLPFRLPEPFPQNSLYAARLALIGQDEGWAAAFTHEVFSAQFGAGANLTDTAALKAALDAAGQDAEAVIKRAAKPEIKDRLKAQTEEARMAGIFGAPAFITQDRELFWGDDRLEQAVAWSAAGQ